MNGEPYTPTEERIVKRYYPTKGAHYTHRELQERGYNRSIHSVRKKAQTITAFGEVKGYVPLVDVHPMSWEGNIQANKSALKQAEKDGVLLEAGKGKRRVWLVPEEWAEEYLARVTPLMRADEECRSWLSTREVGELMGAPPRTISAYKKHPRGSILSDAVGMMRMRKGMQHLYWEPSSVREAIAWFRSETR